MSLRELNCILFGLGIGFAFCLLAIPRPAVTYYYSVPVISTVNTTSLEDYGYIDKEKK